MDPIKSAADAKNSRKKVCLESFGIAVISALFFSVVVALVGVYLTILEPNIVKYPFLKVFKVDLKNLKPWQIVLIGAFTLSVPSFVVVGAVSFIVATICNCRKKEKDGEYEQKKKEFFGEISSIQPSNRGDLKEKIEDSEKEEFFDKLLQDKGAKFRTKILNKIIQLYEEQLKGKEELNKEYKYLLNVVSDKAIGSFAGDTVKWKSINAKTFVLEIVEIINFLENIVEKNSEKITEVEIVIVEKINISNFDKEVFEDEDFSKEDLINHLEKSTFEKPAQGTSYLYDIEAKRNQKIIYGKILYYICEKASEENKEKVIKKAKEIGLLNSDDYFSSPEKFKHETMLLKLKSLAEEFMSEDMEDDEDFSSDEEF